MFPSRWEWSAGVALLGVLAVLGYRLVYAQFQGYDDEGYLLVTVRQFLEGRPLYDDVYTQYGPAYYLWQWALHGLLAIPVTNDATRLVTLAVWLTVCVLVGLQVWWISRLVSLAMLGSVVAFFHLAQLSFEPGHPQELCVLGVLGVLTLTTWRLARGGPLGSAAALAVGALVAVTALTKPNVGAFLGIAVVLGLATGLPRGRGRTCAVAVGTLAALLAMVGIMSADLGRRDIVLFLVVMIAAVVSCVVVGTSGGEEHAVVSPQEIAAVIAGTALTGGAVIAATMAMGTSAHGLVEGLLVWPRRMPAIFWFPMPVPLAAALMAPAWLAFALGRQRRSRRLEHWWLVVARPIGIFALVASLSQRYVALVAGGPPLVWPIVSGPLLTDAERLARRLLGVVAVLMVMQVYPMPAGTQSATATVLLVPVALVILWDADRAEAAARRSRSSAIGKERLVVLGSFGALLAVILASNAIVRSSRGTPIGLPGALSVHASERDVATYTWLAANVKANCGAFITAPGLNSLHLWTGMPPITTFNATLWPILLDEAQQSRARATAEHTDRICIVWHARRMADLMAAALPPSKPLAEWMEATFVRHAAVGPWEIRTQPGHATVPAHEARWRDGDIDVWAPRIETGSIVRLAVVDLDAGRVLADSASSEPLAVFDAAGTRLAPSQGLDLSVPRQLLLRGAPQPSAQDAFVIVRLWSRDGTLTIVPVVTAHQSEASVVEHAYPPTPPE